MSGTGSWRGSSAATSTPSCWRPRRRSRAALPIRARQDSAGYRASRFARRHWLPLSAAALLIASLAAGIVAATYQARRAERRFQQVRSIANALMVDVHEAIRDLPASTAAQEVVVRTAVQYLDGLSQEAGGDPALQLEIAYGYMKVAELSYSLSRPSLGRADDARRAYDKAGAVLASLGAGRGGDLGVVMASTTLQTLLGEFFFDTGRPDESLAALLGAVDTAESVVTRHADDLGLLEALREAQNQLVSLFTANPAVTPHVARYVEVSERIARLRPDGADSSAQLGVAYSQAANHAAFAEDIPRARELYRRNIELQRRAVELEPDHATARRNLMIAWSNLGDLALGPLGASSYTGSGGPLVDIGDARRQEARDAFEGAIEQAEWLRRHDPGNDTVKYDYAICLGRQAPSWPPGDPGAIGVLEQSIAVLDELERSHPARTWRFLVEFHGSLAERLRQSGRLDRALAEWAATEAVVQKWLAAEPDNYYPRRLMIPVLANWAGAVAADGRRATADRVARRALQMADEVGAREAQYARAAGWPPRARGWLADVYERLGDAATARTLREESRGQWQALASRTDLSNDLVVEARREAGR